MPVAPDSTRPVQPAARPAHRVRWMGLVLASVLALGLVGGSSWWIGRGNAAHEGDAPGGPSATDAAEESVATAPRVDVVHPRTGGLVRQTSQPGSIHAFESVDMYAKVSGFLKTQEVDIGDRVKRGDVLAVIDAPELEKDVEETAA